MNGRLRFLEERPGEIDNWIGGGGGVLGESSEILPESLALEIWDRLSGFIVLKKNLYKLTTIELTFVHFYFSWREYALAWSLFYSEKTIAVEDHSSK